MTKTFPAGSKFASLCEVKEAVSAAYSAALKSAKRECGRGTYISRGKALRAVKGGEIVAGEAECWLWDGTLKGLLAAIDEARFEHRADELAIDGGINYALNPRDYGDGFYDPMVGEWSVTVWEKPEA